MGYSNKIRALAKHLEIKPSEIEQSSYDKNSYSAEGAEYTVFTDKEACQAVRENILDSLWAFNSTFIEAHSNLPRAAIQALAKAQAELCEGANDLVKGVIRDLDHFVDDAVRCDGRGHFLSGYDGEENEEKIGNTWYFIYRTN